MKRREFITLLSGAAAWPITARAQPTTPVVGFLSSLTAQVTTKRIASFSGGLREAGQIVDRDVAIKQRLADGQYDRLPALAADLVKQRVSLIAALAPPAAFAAKAATTTIPIVFVGALDPARPASSRASTGRGATSRALLSSVRLWVPNDLSLPASSQTLASAHSSEQP